MPQHILLWALPPLVAIGLLEALFWRRLRGTAYPWGEGFASIGVAIGHTSFVQDDIAKGRLVAPFDMTLPAEAGYYFVAPPDKIAAPKVDAFRAWLIRTSRAPQQAFQSPS